METANGEPSLLPALALITFSAREPPPGLILTVL